MLNAKFEETQLKFARTVYQPFDTFFLYQKDDKWVCALFAINSDMNQDDPFGFQFTFTIPHPEKIPKQSLEKKEIRFNNHFR